MTTSEQSATTDGGDTSSDPADPLAEDSIEELQAHKPSRAATVDSDEEAANEQFELPGADLSHEELAIEVKPIRSGEFTCTRCFLVRSRSQLADPDQMTCYDCA